MGRPFPISKQGDVVASSSKDKTTGLHTYESDS